MIQNIFAILTPRKNKSIINYFIKFFDKFKFTIKNIQTSFLNSLDFFFFFNFWLKEHTRNIVSVKHLP